MPDEQRPRDCALLYVPAYAERQFDVLWGADRAPYGLIVDGRAYRVKPARRLLVRPGFWQHVYDVRERPAEPPEAPERP